MVKILTRAVVIVVMLCMVVSMSNAEEGVPELKVSAKGEIWLEQSDGLDDNKGDSKITANELYLIFDAKFDDNHAGKITLDGADIVSSDGEATTEKIVEEANFTVKHIGGAPVSVVFGKGEMPFGQDYDKMLSDPLVHAFEIDKVWGIHGIVDIAGVGSLAGATYYHRNSIKDDETRIGMDNELGDNYCARFTVDKLIPNIKGEVSYAQESYSAVSREDDTTGETSIGGKDDERRVSVGITAKAGPANVAVEYIATENRKGRVGFDPGLVSFAADLKVNDKLKLHAKYEQILEDSLDDVEEDFFAGGVEYTLADQLGLFVEVLNYNTGGLADGADLTIADGSMETSFKVGFRGKY